MKNDMGYNLKTGRMGENAVCAYIESQGMRTLQRNFYCRGGEIDVVARDGAYIVFIEVKTRRSLKYGSAAEAVTPAKMRKLSLAAAEYIGKNGLDGTDCRFDVAEVYLHEGKPPEINYIKNAF